MEVKICARCLSTEKTQIFSQNLSNIECIFDLKKTLEPVLSVAALDQNVYYKTRLLDDRKTLSSLYVGEEDSFVIEFKAQCNMQALIQVFDRMKKFLAIVDKERKVCLYKPEIFNELHDCYDDLDDCFEICCYELFIPWNNQASIANRHFFMQEGGLDMLLAIYKFSRKQIKSQEYHKDSEKENIRMFYEHQNVLEYMCLLTLWNYSELKQDRRMVLQKIGLDMFLESLIRDPDCYGQIRQINEAAVGCLAQYIEMADVQQTVANNVEALTKLISLVSSHSTAVYHNEVAANTVFCCSNHPKAAMQMIFNQTYLLVIQTLKPLPSVSEEEPEENGQSVAVRYYLCLYLANIQTLPEEKRFSSEEKNDIDAIMENFLSLHTPSEIGAYEISHDYVWITLAPFVQLALSCPELPRQQSTEMMHQCDLVSASETLSVCSICGVDQCNDKHMLCSFSVAAKIGLFSLCHLTKTKGNQELFKKGKLVDYLVCIRWFAKRCHIINSLVPELSGFGQLEPPRLQSIAKAYLAKCYGKKITLEL